MLYGASQKVMISPWCWLRHPGIMGLRTDLARILHLTLDRLRQTGELCENIQMVISAVYEAKINV